MADTWLENRVFDEMQIGETANIVRRITKRDIDLFAVVSGDMNPTHFEQAFIGAPDEIVAHRILGGALISAVLGTKLPGPGTVYKNQELSFLGSVHVDDVVDTRLTVCAKDEVQKLVYLDCVITNQRGEEIIKGVAQVYAPAHKIRHHAMNSPEAEVVYHNRLRALVEKAKAFDSMRCAVVHPCDEVSLQGAADAAEEGLIIPVLVGPEAKIRAAAEAAHIDISQFELVDAPHSHAAAIQAVALARDGQVSALMKGSLHTDEYMRAVVHKEKGLRTERRMSHVFVMDVPSYKFPLLITDAALNIAPDLPTKADIIQNAIYLAHDMGLANPKVAVLAATETVGFSMPATMDAAVLCKMADRGQIVGGTLDGPLAFDNAISAEAARIKHIVSPVAGDADILMVPNIEAGNMLVKQLAYLAAAVAPGLVLGARVPVMLTSRADPASARMAAAALAVLSVQGDKERQASAGKA